MSRKGTKFRVNNKNIFYFLIGCLNTFLNKGNKNWIKGKDISFGNNCICKTMEVEISVCFVRIMYLEKQVLYYSNGITFLNTCVIFT